MDFIPLDPSLVKESHCRISEDSDNYHLLITQEELLSNDLIDASKVLEVILHHLNL